MARGRFISKEITLDKKVNSLSSAYSMLAFTWLLTHADGYGRTYGDPAVVRSMVFPRRPEVTVDDVDGYIREWSDARLVIWYEVAGDMYIEFPNFSKHQIGLNITKEAKSNIPPNPASAGKLPEDSGELPEDSGKLPEDSGKLPEDSGKLPPEVNSKLSVIEGEEEVEVEGDNDSDIITFCEITQLPIPAIKAVRDTWLEQLTDLKAKGVTENIIRRACKELTEKGTYRITSPKSIIKACDVVLAEKKRKSADGYVPMSGNPEYAGIVNR